MAPYFVGTPKVVIHPGAMSLDHPIRDKAALYDNLRRSVEELDYAAAWSCCWKTCRRTPGISAGSG